jgi:hypothetical protein
MARNRNRARRGPRRRAGRNGGFGSNDLMSRRDLIVGGGYVNNSGAQVATSSWNGNAITLATNTQAAYQAVVIPQAVTAANAPPSIGECMIQDVEGSLYLTNPTVTGVYYIGFGIYISKFDSRTGTWGIRYPSTVGSDAARDDWLALRVIVATLPVPGAVTDPMMLELRLALPHPVILGGGEALHVCVDNNGSSSGSINVLAYFRTRIADVT